MDCSELVNPMFLAFFAVHDTSCKSGNPAYSNNRYSGIKQT